MNAYAKIINNHMVLQCKVLENLRIVIMVTILGLPFFFCIVFYRFTVSDIVFHSGKIVLLVFLLLQPWAPRYWRYFFNCHALLAFFNCRFLWLLPWINLGANINTNTLRHITGTKHKHSCELIYRTCLNLIRLA